MPIKIHDPCCCFLVLSCKKHIITFYIFCELDSFIFPFFVVVVEISLICVVYLHKKCCKVPQKEPKNEVSTVLPLSNIWILEYLWCPVWWQVFLTCCLRWTYAIPNPITPYPCELRGRVVRQQKYARIVIYRLVINGWLSFFYLMFRSFLQLGYIIVYSIKPYNFTLFVR